MKLILNTNSLADYQTFLAIKRLPLYRMVGHEAWFPDEYASRIGLTLPDTKTENDYKPMDFLFDYQASISRLSIRKKKFALFMGCGLGKTMIYAEYIRHVAKLLPREKRILMVAPLMVVRQTLEELSRWYGKLLPMVRIEAANLKEWLLGGHNGYRIGITNYESIRDDLQQGVLGCIVADESSTMKSHYGSWGTRLIELGRGLDYKLAGTGTPAPNDRIEYANHAVFLDQFPNVNSFLSNFFVNRGQTDNRWELKPHALAPFYRNLSHWSIFMENPATYGWKDNVGNIPPIRIHIQDVAMTEEQSELVYKNTSTLFATEPGGIKSRSVLSQIGKGSHRGKDIETNKPDHIRRLVESWPGESTIIWCLYNREQEIIHRQFPDAANIEGDTPYDEREKLIDDFKSGRRKVLISKPKCLGFGLNLQICTKMIFSGLQDSWEQFHQAVKRANRIGSTVPLDVYVPVVDVELPMVETVLQKAKRVELDNEAQEKLFKENAYEF